MPVPGKLHHARQDFQHLVVALEGRCAAVLRPVGSETDLRYVPVRRPERGDLPGAFRRLAVHQHHVRVHFVNLVKLGPDQSVIAEVQAAGDEDFRTRRKKYKVPELDDTL